MSQDDPKWAKTDVNGPNEQLLRIAEKISELTKFAMNQELDKVKQFARAEALKHGNHPALKAIADNLEKMKVD
jgi:hypothetical protein